MIGYEVVDFGYRRHLVLDFYVFKQGFTCVFTSISDDKIDKFFVKSINGNPYPTLFF